MATVSIHMPELTGEAGPFTLFVRKTSDGTLLNAGGDFLHRVRFREGWGDSKLPLVPWSADRHSSFLSRLERV